MKTSTLGRILVAALACGGALASAQNLKITPLGSHAGELCDRDRATVGGKVKPTSRTAAFLELVKSRPVYLALSGRTMEFDGNAKCVAGC